jgi:6-phosphofructokinase 1
VLVLQAMGRKIGYIPAAARLADPKREMPLQIYMSESQVTIKQLADNVSDQLRRDGRCVVVVSEGFDAGSLGESRDSFGHVQFSSSQMTVAQKVVNYLNEKGLAARGSARANVVGTDQRHAMIYASRVDLEEAYQVGRKAVLLALEDGNGWMSTLLRESGEGYRVRYDKAPLDEVANSERFFPQEWITENRIDVTDDFVKYCRPLIGDEWAQVPLENGIQRFARLEMKLAEKRCPEYAPQAHRT